MTFTDAVNTGQLKICKASTEPTLANTTFNFEFQYHLKHREQRRRPHAGTVLHSVRSHSGRRPPWEAGPRSEVFEDATLGVEVSTIGVDNGTLSGSDVSGVRPRPS